MPIYTNAQGDFLVSFYPAKINQIKYGAMHDGLFGFRQKYFVISKQQLSDIFVWMLLTAIIQITLSVLSALIFVNHYGEKFFSVNSLEKYFILSVFLFIMNYMFTYTSKVSMADISPQDTILLRDTAIFHSMLVLGCFSIGFIYLVTIIANNSSVLMVVPLMAFIAIAWMHVRLLIDLSRITGVT